VSEQVKGTFQVQMKSQEAFDTGAGAKLARMRLEKQFEGELSATGLVEMLSAVTETQGSAGYVAIERVEGSLRGRRGSFVLQHNGRMDRGVASLTVTVVPDSATLELTGLAGSMSIEIVDKQHFYTLDYTLPAL
jgi:hypothetical protein